VKYLVDTNVISEIRKDARSNPGVAAWYATVTDEDLCLSVLVLGEIAKGVELKRRRDPAQADLLEAWLDQIKIAFGDRALPVDVTVIEAWGRMAAIRPIPVVDGLLAATAKVHDLTLVTRNEADVADLGARILNPFD